jgi:hypothetical protein
MGISSTIVTLIGSRMSKYGIGLVVALLVVAAVVGSLLVKHYEALPLLPIENKTRVQTQDFGPDRITPELLGDALKELEQEYKAEPTPQNAHKLARLRELYKQVTATKTPKKTKAPNKE